MAKKKTNVDADQAEGSDGSMAVNDAWTGLLAISLLALMIGAGFLAWDYFLYYDGNPVPPPPYLTGKGPGTPGPAKPVDPPKEKEKDDGKKNDDKKDAAVRVPLIYCMNSAGPEAVLFARTRLSPILSNL